LNVALVTETYPPEINGVAMTLSRLVEGLRQRRHRVTIVRPRQRHEKQAGVSTDELVCRGFPIPGYTSMRIGLPIRQRLLRTWRNDRPCVVHVATEGPLGLAAVSAARRLDIPVTSSFHTNFHSYSRHYGIGFLTRPALAYLRWFHNRTRLTLSPTLELNEQLTSQGFQNMRLLARGVDVGLFAPSKRDRTLREAWGAKSDDLVVLHVSRIAAEKNFPLLLRAFSAIRQKDPLAKFVVTSDGPLRKKLERAHPWIHFTGSLDRPALARHYASADLFLYPSLTETFGNVVLEAMSSGLPVLAFNYAATKRYIQHDKNGWSIPSGEAVPFVDDAVRLASDPALRLRLGVEARQTALGIPWDRVVDGFETDLLETTRQAGVPSSPSPRSTLP
jgi:glycosyltransferase involved in cell wall biosynthesis